MPPAPRRPAGTDGSDHRYRMTVEDKYKRAAAFRGHLTRLLLLQALATAAGAVLSKVVLGNLNLPHVALFACAAFATGQGYYGRSRANRRVHLNLHKVASLACAAMGAVLGIASGLRGSSFVAAMPALFCGVASAAAGAVTSQLLSVQ